jgi:hypothetical protein
MIENCVFLVLTPAVSPGLIARAYADLTRPYRSNPTRYWPPSAQCFDGISKK